MIHQIILNYTIQRELNQNATIHDLRILILKMPISSISNLNTLGHICLLTVAIAAIVNKKEDKICSLSKLKRAS